MDEQDRWYEDFEDSSSEPTKKTRKYYRSKFKPKRKKNFNKQSDYRRRASQRKD